MQTGAYVYASPAVTNAPGLGPMIYLGSYDGTFYALNARSGRIAWHFNAHGKISGSATIVGRTVYFADLGTHRTYGLGISTGRVTFEKDTGSFDPVDQRRQEHLPDRPRSALRADAALSRRRPAPPAAQARQEPTSPSARASEKRACTSSRPGSRATTRVQPPGA